VGRLRAWLVDRLSLEPILRFIREHRVPAAIAGRKGWMYVFGFSTLTVLLLQVVTGLALTTVYVPAPDAVHSTLLHLTEESRWGALTRALHFYGASAMVVFMTIHMARVYLTASYKHPREMGWITGVFLFGLVMAMALTGQLLRWDENGMWTVVVTSKFLARVPFIGGWLAEFALAGPTVTGLTLSRFYSLHILVLPLFIAAFVALHLYMVVTHGISEPPRTGEPVDPATYRERYGRLKRHGVRYWPFVVWREVVMASAVVGGVFLLALTLGPEGPALPADPTDVTADPQPDWFVRWYYALLWVKPRGLETFVMVWLPILVFLALVALPLVAPKGERSLVRRPWAPVIVLGVLAFFVTLTGIGVRPPWSPAVDTAPLGEEELGVAEGPVYDGAHLFFHKGCQYCHVALDRGGRYGPDLTHVTLRMSPPHVADWVIAGRGDMPAYRGALTGAEMAALMRFLEALPEAQRRMEAR
jgi:ubiquinol-cytochrome c reductase cytochrome b subunit